LVKHIKKQTGRGLLSPGRRVCFCTRSEGSPSITQTFATQQLRRGPFAAPIGRNGKAMFIASGMG